MSQELEYPKRLLGHFVKDGEPWHAMYVRFLRPDGSFGDYKVHRTERRCDCEVQHD